MRHPIFTYVSQLENKSGLIVRANYPIALCFLNRKIIVQIPDKSTSTYIIRLKKEVCPVKIVATKLNRNIQSIATSLKL